MKKWCTWFIPISAFNIKSDMELVNNEAVTDFVAERRNKKLIEEHEYEYYEED